MTITGSDGRAGAPDQAVVDAAMLVLDRMGLTPADLLSAPAARPAAPTFAEYVPVVSALVTDGCRRAVGGFTGKCSQGDRTPEKRKAVRNVKWLSRLPY